MDSARVLIIRDSYDLEEGLDDHLRRAGFSTQVCVTNTEGIRLAPVYGPAMILLDFVHDDATQIEVCRQLKSHAATNGIPTIIVSSRSDEIDRVVTFELGVDDYVVRPYSMHELVLRMRRSLGRHASSPAKEDWLRVGDIQIDIVSHRVWVANKEVDLPLAEFRVLLALCQNQSRVTRRQHLMDCARHDGAEFTPLALNFHVRRLRRCLGQAGSQIRAVKHVGYCLRDNRH